VPPLPANTIDMPERLIAAPPHRSKISAGRSASRRAAGHHDRRIEDPFPSWSIHTGLVIASASM